MITLPAETDLIAKRYALNRLLGSGAMGSVYEATDRLRGQRVALKRLVVQRDSGDDQTQQGDVLRLALGHEFQTLASLRHPNIINVLDYGFDERQQPYFTMPLLEPAQDVLGAARDLPLADKIGLVIQILQALVYLHRQGIIHRDLKPDNVLVTGDRQLKVLDFGVARNRLRKQVSGVAGTPMYIAPEIWLGGASTEASDLYAVGVIAYQMLTNRSPYSNLHSMADYLEAATIANPDLTFLAESIGVTDAGATQPDADRPRTAVLPGEGVNPSATLPMPGREGVYRETAHLSDVNVNGHVIESGDAAPKTMMLNALPQRELTPASMRSAEPEPAPIALSEPIAQHPLVAMIGKLLAKSPAMRYRTADDAIRDLNAAIGLPSSAESSELRESFLQTAIFTGRDAELTELLLALDGMQRGQGSLWLVGGESGVGKSRLLDELRIRAIVEGSLVVRGQAIVEAATPFLIWQEPLRRLVIGTDIDDLTASVLLSVVPDIGLLLGRPVAPAPALDGKATDQRLSFAVRDLILNAVRDLPGGLVIILEDLQWAAKDLDLLRSLTPLLTSQRLMILGTYRIDEEPTLPDKLPGHHLIRLNRLDAGHIADLSVAMLGQAAATPNVVRYLQQQTEGNVFFLVEVIRALAEEAGQLDRIGSRQLPDHVFASGMQRIIERRLEHVPAPYRDLLRVAAIKGRQLDLAVLTQLAAGVNLDDWLTACVNAAVLEFQDERWRFAHDKLREFLLDNLPVAQSADLYRQVAETTEQLYAARVADYAHELAYLWSHTDNGAKELRYSRLAGDRSLAVDAYAEATRLFTRALELIDRLGAALHRTDQIEIHISLGRTYENLGAFDLARQHFDTALTISRAANDSQQESAALLRLGWVNIKLGNVSQGAQDSFKSIDAARQADNLQLLARARYLNGIAHLIVGEYQTAAETLQQASETAATVGDQHDMADILNAWASAIERLGQFDEARQRFEDAKQIASRIGYKSLQANIAGNIGHLLYSRQSYDEARSSFELGATIFHELGNVFGEAQTLYDLGCVALAQKRNAQALGYFKEALALSTRIKAVPITLHILVGFAQLQIALAELWGDESRREIAVEMLSMVMAHPAREADIEIELRAQPLINQMQAVFAPDQFAAALERGQTRDLETVIAEIGQLQF